MFLAFLSAMEKLLLHKIGDKRTSGDAEGFELKVMMAEKSFHMKGLDLKRRQGQEKIYLKLCFLLMIARENSKTSLDYEVYASCC